MNEQQALVILSSFPQLGSSKIRLLLQKFGSAIEVLRTSLSEIAQIPEIGLKISSHWEKWQEGEEWKKNLDLIEKSGTHILTFKDSQYPKRLLDIRDFPLLLYMKGELKPQDQQCIAIIGTRQASQYGIEMAEKLASELATLGFTIISGLARGVDTAAHRGALKKGRTLAVIGSGLGQIYPPENQTLSEQISRKGAVLSEYPMNSLPERHHFPQRNRILCGMSLATVLIEAPLESGAMLAMEKGASQGKKLFALPGRANEKSFRGNHLLIKKGKAQLIENAEEIVESLSSFPFINC